MSNINPAEKQIEVKTSASKALIIGGITIGIAAFVLVGYLIYGLLTTPAPTAEQIGIGAPTVISEENIPKIIALQIRHDDPLSPTADLQAKINPVPEGLYVEWEVTDIERNTMGKGIFDTTGILDRKIVLKNDVNNFIFRIRVSNGIQTSEWYQQNLDPVDGTQIPNSTGNPNSTTHIEPYDAYYETAWAKGEPGVQNLEKAVETAWGIEKVDYYTDTCMYLNQQKLDPGELVAPTPNEVPSDLVLKYEVLNNLGTSETLSLQYYWCTSITQI